RPAPGAVAIVVAALAVVGQHRIRDRQLLEPLLGGLVAGIPIRLPPERELPVRALDLDVGRAAADAQRFVVIGRQAASPPTARSACRWPTRPTRAPVTDRGAPL